MKKYFLTMATVALFAVGFAASDEEESSSNETPATQTEQQAAQVEPNEEEQEKKVEEKVFKPGNSYISNLISDYNDVTVQYELSMYNDGTFELKESYRHSEGGIDYFYEDKWQKKTESRKDITKTWYCIDGKHARNDYGHGTKILVDEDGKIYQPGGGYTEYDAVGNECFGTFRKK